MVGPTWRVADAAALPDVDLGRLPGWENSGFGSKRRRIRRSWRTGSRFGPGLGFGGQGVAGAAGGDPREHRGDDPGRRRRRMMAPRPQTAPDVPHVPHQTRPAGSRPGFAPRAPTGPRRSGRAAGEPVRGGRERWAAGPWGPSWPGFEPDPPTRTQAGYRLSPPDRWQTLNKKGYPSWQDNL